MSKLPYGLAPTHLTGEQAYDLWNADSPDRYKNLSKLSKAKWTDLADWINDRATASVDVSERVAERLAPGSGTGYIKTIIHGQPHEPALDVGMDIHDDDIAAAALRFYKAFGPAPDMKPTKGFEEVASDEAKAFFGIKDEPKKVQTNEACSVEPPSSADRAAAITNRLIETLGEVIVLGAKLALQK